MSVAANLARIKETLGAAPVTLVAVTKNVGVDAIEEAFKCGVTEFGENRVQDGLEKQKNIPAYMTDKVRWHLIGHLQTNKVKKVVGNFQLIHSVDSVHLAREISREAVKQALRQPVLLQVKIVEDPSKSGFAPEELLCEFPALQQLPGLRIEGLMTIAPLTADQAVWRLAFGGLKDLRDAINRRFDVQLKELSMGMSQDWQEAVGCGATMVRLGRAVFGTAGGEPPARPS